MPAERFFIKQARRFPGGPVLYFMIEGLPPAALSFLSQERR